MIVGYTQKKLLSLASENQSIFRFIKKFTRASFHEQDLPERDIT
jgi:hypothetical protein